MNCDDYEFWMHEDVDGELPPASRALLDAHCGGCPACHALRRDLLALREATRVLPAATDPPADLWRRIEARLDAPEKVERPATLRRWHGPALRLALAAGLVGALAGGLLWRELPEAPETSGAMSASSAVEALEADYRAARAAFMDAVAQKADAIDADTLAVVRDNLAVIDGAVGEIRVALAADPDNTVLMELLVAARERELALFAAVLDLPDAG